MSDLRARFGFVLALALLPLLIFSIWQSFYDYQKDSDARYASLVMSARQSSSEILVRLEQAKSVLRTMDETVTIDDCQAELRNLKSEFFGFDGFHLADASGVFLCSTDTALNTVARFENFERITRRSPFVLQTRQIISDAPTEHYFVRVAYGSYKNNILHRILLADLSPQQLTEAVTPNATHHDVRVAVLSGDGDLLAGQSMLDRDSRKQWANKARKNGEYVETFVTPAGQKRELVVIPTQNQQIYIAFDQAHQSVMSWNLINPLSSSIIPFLAWIFGFIAIWLATDQLILGHLRRMRLNMMRFGSGNHKARIGILAGAPSSIRELGDTFDDMAERISAREAELADLLSEKETLLREIHHRVKNNLQIIISLLNIQERKVSDPQGLDALQETRSRINAIALVHRGLYESEDLRFIPMEIFLDRLIVELSVALGASEQNITITSRAMPVAFEADTAIPVALFMVEALTNAVKHGVADGGSITAELTQDGEIITAAIYDSGMGYTAKDTLKGTGSRLMDGFARQLSGTLHNDVTDKGHSVKLVFSRRPYKQIT